MANLVGFAAVSHSPYWDINAEPGVGPGADFLNGVKQVRQAIAELRPDTLVVFGPDHFRNFFYDLMPAFCIGLGDVSSFGEFFSDVKGPLPVDRMLARYVCDQAMEDGFDPAISMDMGVDHGVSQPFAALRPSEQTALLAIMINANGAPRPSLRRCFAFGRAVGRAIRSYEGAERVFVVGSGGLSHWPQSMSLDHPGLSEEMRSYVINGRSHAQENSTKRDERFQQRKGQVTGRLNPEWDRWLLSTIESGDYEPILSLTPDEVERDGGTGAHEIASWIAALGAWDGAIDYRAYEPVPSWLTGMGCIAAISGHSSRH